MRIYINDIELNVDARFQMKYQVTDGLSANGAYSTELELAPTSNNLRAFGLNDMVITEDDVFNFYPARADENGVDMGIEKAELISINPFSIRLYGTNSNFFASLKGKLSDLDWTDLDHVWNSTNIPAGKNNLTGYTYPIINYGILDTVTNNIQCSECYPAVYVKTAVEKMTEGYTLDLEFDSDYKYDKLIIPFSNEYPISMTAEEKSTCGFVAYAYSGFLINSGFTQTIAFADEIYDAGGNYDGTTYKYTAPFDMRVSFFMQTDIKSTVIGGSTEITFKLYKDNGSEVLLAESVWLVNDTYITANILEFREYFEVNAGDTVYVKVYSAGDNATMRSNFDANGDPYSSWGILDISDGLLLGFTWRIGLNLPDITQAQLVEYVLQSFGSVIQVDERKKVIYMTQIDTIANSEGEDWTQKVDLSKPIKRTFDMPDIGQVTTLKYLDDENVTKPTGTDYSFAVNSDKLDAEKNLYTAPFAACVSETKFLQGLDVVNIEVDGESPCKPRILLNKIKRLPTAINYQVDYVTVTTDSSVHIPYFYDISKDYDLTWSKLKNNFASKISMLQNPRGLEVYIKLSPVDINQLNFRTKKWIGTIGEEVINAWFFVSEVNYDTHESSFVKLKLL